MARYIKEKPKGPLHAALDAASSHFEALFDHLQYREPDLRSMPELPAVLSCSASAASLRSLDEGEAKSDVRSCVGLEKARCAPRLFRRPSKASLAEQDVRGFAADAFEARERPRTIPPSVSAEDLEQTVRALARENAAGWRQADEDWGSGGTQRGAARERRRAPRGRPLPRRASRGSPPLGAVVGLVAPNAHTRYPPHTVGHALERSEACFPEARRVVASRLRAALDEDKARGRTFKGFFVNADAALRLPNVCAVCRQPITQLRGAEGFHVARVERTDRGHDVENCMPCHHKCRPASLEDVGLEEEPEGEPSEFDRALAGERRLSPGAPRSSRAEAKEPRRHETPRSSLQAQP